MDYDAKDEVEAVSPEPSPDAPKRGRGNPNLAAAREKAMETRRQMAVISKAKREAKKQERQAEYLKALEILNGPSSKPEPEIQPEPEPETKPKSKPKTKPKTKIIEITDSESSSESESESDGSEEDIQVVRVVRKPKSKPKPKTNTKSKPKTKSKPQREESDDEESQDSEEERRLGGAVARDMLRRRVLAQETERAIRRLVPTFLGFK